MTDRRKAASEFDVLGDVLETLRFRGTMFFRSELAAPWGMSFAQTDVPRFHIAMKGAFFVGVEEGDATRVQEMDVVILPSGHTHWLADRPGRTLVRSEHAGEACELGEPLFQQGEITNRLMCGLVNFDQESNHPIFDALPQVLHFPTLEPDTAAWVTVVSIDAELARSEGRSGPIIDRLAEVLFLQLLVRYSKEQDGIGGSFLAALGDRRIHQALALIHKNPSNDWSLSSLGDSIGMSRATLVRHFQEVVGVAPMTYITNWRITKAYSLVKYTNAPLEAVAESVGFASARTLNKAFQRQYGCTPHQLRRKLSQ